jgi:hypothetical protein
MTTSPTMIAAKSFGIPAPVRRVADDGRESNKADQKAAGRAEEIGRAGDEGRGVGEHREADEALEEIGEDGDRPETEAVSRRDQDDRQRLEGHGHRVERHLDLGGDGDQRRAGDHEDDVARDAARVPGP